MMYYCLGLEIGSYVDCQWRDRKLSDFIKNMCVCVVNMKKSHLFGTT